MAKVATKGRCSHYSKLPNPNPTRPAKPAPLTLQDVLDRTQKYSPERREMALKLIAQTLRFNQPKARQFAEYFGFDGKEDWEAARRIAFPINEKREGEGEEK